MTPVAASSFGRVLRQRQAFAWAMRLAFAVGVLVIAAGLWRWGAVEVRGHWEEVFWLSLGGLGWLIVSASLFPWLGFGIADDVLERRNPGALVGLCSATVAVALIYLCGSLGEGPSYGENFFSAALGTFGFLLLWLLLEVCGRVSMSIAEERDLAAGIRLGGCLLALGLILGRALAGNWHSEVDTVQDFLHDGWPAAGIWALAVGMEWFARPNRERPSRPWWSYGLVPAGVYLVLAMAWLWHLGRWEGMPE